jgi:CubicO group peptidase (beta-lactamase class C family)
VTPVLCGWEYAFDGGRIAGQLDERSFGQVDPNGTQASPRTPFVIGSTTKAIRALAVMQLVEGGKVTLDDRVQRYLPWFCVADPRASAEMTVRQLLNQTSGLDSWSGWVSLADFDNTPDAAEKQARDLATLELSRPVGSAFEYSNANYNLLGLIVEAASSETYADYVQNHIFGPLDMRHSYTAREAARQNGLAMGYRWWFTYPVAAPETQSPRGSLAAGELISSTEGHGAFSDRAVEGGTLRGRPDSVACQHSRDAPTGRSVTGPGDDPDWAGSRARSADSRSLVDWMRAARSRSGTPVRSVGMSIGRGGVRASTSRTLRR